VEGEGDFGGMNGRGGDVVLENLNCDERMMSCDALLGRGI